MRRALLLTAVFAAGLGLTALGAGAADAAPVTSGALAVADPVSAPRQGLDDFSFSSYDADFYLGTDSEGRSTLETVETFVAEFPEADQNRGMRRAIPLNYGGHPTDVSVESVVDADGEPRAFDAERNDDGDYLVVTVRADDFVHGAQSYTFRYTQHNVTKSYADTDDDEFYWDTVGFDFVQPFTVVSARVHVPDSLRNSITGIAKCYSGDYGSKTECGISSDKTDEETVFTAEPVSLSAKQNMSIVVGFDTGTFVPRDDSYFAGWYGWAQLGAALFAVLGAALSVIRRTSTLRDARGRPTIIVEYTPPPAANVFTSAVILKRTRRAAASGFVSLAVRGNLQIVERPNDAAGTKKPAYWLHAGHTEGLDAQEREFYDLIFNDKPDGWREITKSDAKLGAAVQAFVKKARLDAVDAGYFKKGTQGASLALAIGVFVAGVGAIIFGALLAGQALGGAVPFIPAAIGLLAVLLSWLMLFRTPLTAVGAELRDYLKGVELYLTVAEEERFRMLQSPEGALKTDGASTTDAASADPGQVVKVYEKLLPFAVLWGVEDEWAKVLGTYYERLDTQPAWYSSPRAFNAGFFAASVGSFATTSASSYSGSVASNSSSSSGGTGGGGFSGGGGGGGGGGGV